MDKLDTLDSSDIFDRDQMAYELYLKHYDKNMSDEMAAGFAHKVFRVATAFVAARNAYSSEK